MENEITDKGPEAGFKGLGRHLASDANKDQTAEMSVIRVALRGFGLAGRHCFGSDPNGYQLSVFKVRLLGGARNGWDLSTHRAKSPARNEHN